jgi:acid phosphatase
MSASTITTPNFDHIVVVVEENHSSEGIIGNSQAGYINWLASHGALLTNYHAVTHPSLPNYFALYAGSTFGVQDDNIHQETGPTLATILQGSGRTFTGFVESGSPQKHNPWESFPEGFSVESDVGNFPSIFSHLPRVSFIVPNLLDDMHDGTIAQGDQWLRAHLDAYAQWAKDNNSLLIVTWDEDDNGPTNHVPTILYGAHVNQGTFGDNYNHYDLLATILDASGLDAPNLAKDAVGIGNGVFGSNVLDGFSPLEYLASNPDLILAYGLNPAAAQQHYVNAGFNEHRATNSFDAVDYLASNPDLITAFGLNPVAAEQHYVTNGFSEHRATNSFDALEYLASNPDLIQAFGLNPLAAERHYVTNGFNEHRVTNSFNAVQYLANYADLRVAFGTDLAAAERHYITNGMSEHRTDQAPVINGDGGANVLVARNGAIMTGGNGADTFVFNSSLLTPATITDFAVGADHLQISASGFGHELTSGGALPLVAAATAASANHAGSTGYFIYDNANTLWWDSTGGSGADAVAQAKLAGVAALHTSDFLLT